MSDFIPFNATVFRGDGTAVHFRNWNIGGTPIDITDWVIFHTAKKRAEDSDDDAEISRDSATDPTVIVKYDNNSNGFPDSFTVNYISADTGTMAPREYFQDVQIIESSGEDPKTRAYGTLLISADVTKRIA